MATHSSTLPWRIPRTEEPTVHRVAKSQTQLKWLNIATRACAIVTDKYLKYCCCYLVTVVSNSFATPWTAAHSYFHRIFQARILEWVVISFFRRSSQLRDQTHSSCIAKQILYHWATREAILNIESSKLKISLCYLTKPHKAVKNESILIAGLVQTESFLPGLYRQSLLSFLYIESKFRKKKKVGQKFILWKFDLMNHESQSKSEIWWIASLAFKKALALDCLCLDTQLIIKIFTKTVYKCKKIHFRHINLQRWKRKRNCDHYVLCLGWGCKSISPVFLLCSPSAFQSLMFLVYKNWGYISFTKKKVGFNSIIYKYLCIFPKNTWA